MIVIYDSLCTNFNNNGLVVLSDAITCIVEEELNGMLECTLEYPLLDGIKRVGVITPPKIIGQNKVGEMGINQMLAKWQYLTEGNIIKADGQLFRIYHKVKTLNSIKINARHIFYDLLENLLEDVRPTGLSGYGALDWILTRTQYAHPFTSTGDVGGINTKYFIRKNPVDAIMGQDGIIATWGGELDRDNFLIKLLVSRGLDRGVLVAYGKNIQGIEETLDTSGICTRLMPIGKDGLLLAEKYIDSPYINNYPSPKIKVVEFSDAETEETLRTAGQQYMLNSKIDIPQFNYKIDFLELSKTEEYKNYAVLERVYLGDTVTVKHSKLNINLKAKVIKATKNVLTDRLEKVELGSFKPNLATGINNTIQQVKQEIINSSSFLQLAIDNATTLLTTALGGYVVKRDGELLIMDTEDPMTATKVWRWNVNGLGYSSTGINGPYGLAMTMDGHIVANFVDTGVLNASIIKAGILKSFNNLSWINMEDGTFSLGSKVIFDGTNFTIKLGNPNLVANGGFEEGIGSWGAFSAPKQFTTDQVNAIYSGSKSMIFVDTQVSDATVGTLTGGFYQNLHGLVVGKVYTFQAMVYVQAAGGLYCGVDATGITENDLVHMPAYTGWIKAIQTFTATNTDPTIFFLIHRNNSASDGDRAFYVDNVQVEEGDIATPWHESVPFLEINEAHARFGAADGSYTEMVPGSTGMKWHKAGVNHDYSYLNTVQSIVVGAYSTTTVTLPVEYKGKLINILISTGGAIQLYSQDNANATFVIKEVLGNPSTLVYYLAIA